MKADVRQDVSQSRLFHAGLVDGKAIKYRWRATVKQNWDAWSEWKDWDGGSSFTVPDSIDEPGVIEVEIEGTEHGESGGAGEPKKCSAVVGVVPLEKRPSTPAVWSPGVAWAAGLAALVLYVLTLVLVYAALHDKLDLAKDRTGYSAVLAIVLLAIGFMALLASIFLAVLELRGKSVMVDSVSDSHGDLSSGVLPDLKGVLEQFRQFRNTLAVAFSALACFWFAWALADGAQDLHRPASTVSNSTAVAPTSTEGR